MFLFYQSSSESQTLQRGDGDGVHIATMTFVNHISRS